MTRDDVRPAPVFFGRRMRALIWACLPALLRFAACTSAILACTSAVHAEVTAPSNVEISLAKIHDEQLESALHDVLSRVQISPTFTRDVAAPPAGPPSHELLAFVRIEAMGHEIVRVTIVDPRHDREFVRDFRMNGELDEIEREELAQVVVHTVEVMRVGKLVGVPRPSVVRHEAPARPDAALVRRAYVLELESAFSARTFAEVAPIVVGTGAALAVVGRAGPVPVRTSLLVEQRSAFSVATRGTASRFGQHAFRADVAAELPIAGVFDLVLGAGGGVALVTNTTTVLASSAPRAAMSHGLDAVPVFGVFNGVKAAIHPRLALRLDLGLDVPVGATSYVVESIRDVVVLSPHAARGVARTGLVLRF